MKISFRQLEKALAALALAAPFVSLHQAFAVTGADFTVPPNITDGIIATGGSFITINTGGTVTGSGGTRAIRLNSNGYTITNHGIIQATGTQRGIDALSAGSDNHIIDNYGSITGNSQRALDMDLVTSITNHTGAIIKSTSQRAIDANNITTLDNDGEITGGGNHAVDINAVTASTKIYNRVNGVIKGAAASNGIGTSGNLDVENWGTITAGDDGLKADGTVTVINYATGKILSTDASDSTSGIGIDGLNGAPNFLITNYGLIESAGDTGINGDQSGKVVNYGTVRGKGLGNADGDGIDVDQRLELENHGAVEATNATLGEGVTTGHGIIKNFAGATIFGGRDGITIVGLTPGDSDPPTPALGSGDITNAGTITGNIGYGIYFVGTENTGGVGAVFNHALINSGSITGGNGTAVRFAQGNDLMVIKDGSVITGQINASAGTDTLEFSTSSNLSAANFNALNFENLKKSGSGTLAMNGNVYGVSSIQIEEGTLDFGGQTFTVTAGNSFSGNGTFDGNLTIGADGILAPGNSPGHLLIDGNLILEAGAIYKWEVGGPSGGPSLFDLVSVTGTVTALGPWYLDVVPTSYIPTFDSFVVLDPLGGALDPSVFNNLVLRLPGSPWSGRAAVVNDQLVLLDLNGAPEPATAGLLGLGALSLLTLTRRRRA